MTRSIQTTSKMAPSSLLLSTALAACTVGPDYTPPKAELAPFHNLVDASTPQARSAPPLDRWRDRHPAVCCGSDVRQSRALFCEHHRPPMVVSPLTMIAAALTIFRSGFFRAFELIVHLILQNKITGYFVDTRSSILASHCSDGPVIAPARGPFVPWMGAAASQARAALADGDHCRKMAGRLRELARLTHSPGMRRELVDLARRYDRRGDHFDGRPR